MQIGTFKNTGVGYIGQLHTLTSKALLTREPNRQAGANGPAFRVSNDVTEVGIALSRTGKDSKKPLSFVKTSYSFERGFQAGRGRYP